VLTSGRLGALWRDGQGEFVAKVYV
jgi:hypothetical protein